MIDSNWVAGISAFLVVSGVLGIGYRVQSCMDDIRDIRVILEAHFCAEELENE